MTKVEALRILMLLSRLEGWLASKDFPDWLAEELRIEINLLAKVIKNEPKTMP